MTITTLTRKALETDESNTALFIQRVLLGGVILPHGLQKALGWLGGYGFDATMGYLTDSVGLPAPIAFLVIAAESLGALALIFGLGTRLASLGIAAVMLGAVLTTHLPHGFFMNWMGDAAGEGFEYHLLALGLAIPTMVWGGGRLSIDGWLARRLDTSASDSARGGLVAAARRVAAVALIGGGLMSTSAASADDTRIVVEVSGLRTSDGMILGALFEGRDGWTDEGREVATCRAPIHHGHATCVFENVAPGSYAFAYLHDEDEDGALDRDWIGIPQEGYGFSNDAAPSLGPPSYESAMFRHGAPETVLRVRTRYGI